MARHVSPLLLTVAALTMVGAPGVLAAQACLGNPSFATNHLQLTAGTAFDKGSTSFGASFIGGSESVFGGVGVGGATSDDFDGSTLLVSATAGFQVPLTSGSAQICPIVSGQLGLGPTNYDGLGTDFSSRAVTLGIAAGGELFRSGRIALLPSVSVAFAYTEAEYAGLAMSPRTTETYALAGAALGFVVSDRFSVRPSVSVPIGLAGSDPIFGIGFALNYGGRR